MAGIGPHRALICLLPVVICLLLYFIRLAAAALMYQLPCRCEVKTGYFLFLRGKIKSETRHFRTGSAIAQNAPIKSLRFIEPDCCLVLCSFINHTFSQCGFYQHCISNSRLAITIDDQTIHIGPALLVGRSDKTG